MLLERTHLWEAETVAYRHTHANTCRMATSSKVSREPGNLDFYVQCLDF